MTVPARPTRPQEHEHASGWRVLLRENWYRDVWLFIATGLALWAVLSNSGTLDRVVAGRRFATSLTCGTTNAIIRAGLAEITASPALPPKVERLLDSLGYPSPKARSRAARLAGAQYARSIAESVGGTAGVGVARRVVEPDGTLNCTAVQRTAKT